MPFATKELEREYHSRYRKTAKGRAVAKRANRTWAIKNRERRNAYMREWHARNREHRLSSLRKSYRANPLRRLVLKAKERAGSKGLQFNITAADLMIPIKCPVLGIPIKISDGRPSGNSPTIDRIDNSMGYIKGNVIVVSYRANALKSDASLDELRAIIKFYEQLNAGSGLIAKESIARAY